MVVNIFLIIFVIALLIILSWVWPPDSPWSPWWRTSAKKARAAAKLAKIASYDQVFELGSGDATFLVTVAKEFGARCFGVEIDYPRYLTGRLNVIFNKVSDKVAIKQANFFDTNLSSATVVFVYLVPRVLEKLKPKLFKELAKGTRVISYKYKFRKDPKLKLVSSDSKNQIYLYRFN